jgi:Skp family chaperone for outer membrane proteins
MAVLSSDLETPESKLKVKFADLTNSNELGALLNITSAIETSAEREMREAREEKERELKHKIAEEELERTQKHIQAVQRQIEELRQDNMTYTKLDENDLKIDNMRADMMTYR